MAEDYYSQLGVARNATDAEIKAAYRQIFTIMGMKEFDKATRDELIKFAHEKGQGVS